MNLCQEEGKPGNSKYDSSYIYLSKSRSIFLKEVISKEVAADLSALLLYYDSRSAEEDITLYLHCNGGDADGLINVYDVMKLIRAPIKTVCIGKAYSAAAVLLAAGTKGKRFAMKNSKIMIHGIQCMFPIPGYDQVNSKNYLDFLNTHNDTIMKILSSHTEKPLKQIKEDCKRDMFLDAKQAMNYGIIDKIL